MDGPREEVPFDDALRDELLQRRVLGLARRAAADPWVCPARREESLELLDYEARVEVDVPPDGEDRDPPVGDAEEG